MSNPFAKVKKEMQEVMYKRMTDAEEDERLKPQKKMPLDFPRGCNRKKKQTRGRKRI